MQESAGGKVIFADQLRGIAALLVVLSHLVGVYWLEPEVVGIVTGAPWDILPRPPAATMLELLPFNPGPLGVALFFLISGFVIPFSFRHHDRRSFLLARALRIYPTYLAALFLGLAVRAASCAYWGQPTGVHPLAVLANALLLHDLVGIGNLDLVNWTLVIELKFYLLFAFAQPLLLRWRHGFVLGLAVVALGINLLAALAMPLLPGRAGFAVAGLAQEAMFLPFMLLGTLFFLRMQGRLGWMALLGSSALGMALFLLSWKYGPRGGTYDSAALSYAWGLAIFTLCFLARGWVAPVAVLHHLASISYPLYLVHSILGFVLLRLLMLRFGLGYGPALVLALLAALVLAWALHHLVERRSIAWGKALGRAPGAARAPQPVSPA
ncbi:acyltransferase [Pseudoroseomonas wenyumeiae]|uniref:Acyltransferase n=1 Tax=Teichococcus wenyumeiae TaxID=2478470 RepID=A0A3A9JHC1_9PROT|nr:acyltransferase [Pseudoroseomonas wenyumeiae]RKK03016.1 acyltransferase [Pseudoroseomonas wenyumeiae]RMI26307.1 acyltransferase [Pseudoroseomonas wenyumeiae]